MKREKWRLLTKKVFRWQDAILLCAFVLMLLLPYVFWNRREGATVLLFCENRQIASYSLSEDRRIPYEHNGFRNLVVIEGGTVRVVEADCPDKVCMNRGAISKESETIVCLPSGLRVEIRGAQGDFDGVTSRREVVL